MLELHLGREQSFSDPKTHEASNPLPLSVRNSGQAPIAAFAQHTFIYEVALLELETRARRTGRETSDCSICLLSFEFNRFTTGAPVYCVARCRQLK